MTMYIKAQNLHQSPQDSTPRESDRNNSIAIKEIKTCTLSTHVRYALFLFSVFSRFGRDMIDYLTKTPFLWILLPYILL